MPELMLVNDEEKAGEPKPLEQPVQVANISIVPSPDLSCAVVSFNLFGSFEVGIKIPGKAIRNFIKQWAVIQRDILDQQRVINKVRNDILLH